jgi:hypothetical protein
MVLPFTATGCAVCTHSRVILIDSLHHELYCSLAAIWVTVQYGTVKRIGLFVHLRLLTSPGPMQVNIPLPYERFTPSSPSHRDVA